MPEDSPDLYQENEELKVWKTIDFHIAIQILHL